jgi:Arc/MetJ-type ribon-helix-helix transcriptional regulator
MSQKEKSEKAGTTQLSLKEQLLGRFTEDAISGKKREVSVMTRMSGDVVEILDALVELDIFKSRSEAVSAFVEQTISVRKPMFEEIKVQASEIRKLRDSAKRQAYAAFQEEGK